ncbi:hypothetical protein SY83_21920 [Paenibacillus swuensis]|uniref:HAMP domain-containing protein n=1 Tax=Paenibacillus swuensis TaxID=1178515 RepID=A0A172TNA1_9BACL|nr:histidine kinase [Paenibacillus swuensis]ANE48500.1 hypothetical protein SY83_21920 [Paenibacillus swuensis]
MFRLNTFSRTLILLLFIFMTFAMMFWYSNAISMKVTRQQIQELNLNRLSNFLREIDEEANRLVSMAITIARDPYIQSLQVPMDLTIYNEITSVNAVEQKLTLQPISSKWKSQLSVFYPQTNRFVSNDPTLRSFPFELTNPAWSYQEQTWNGIPSTPVFAYSLIEPYFAVHDESQIQQVTQIAIPSKTLSSMLRKLNSSHDGGSFFFLPETNKVIADVVDERVESFQTYLSRTNPQQLHNTTLKVQGETYLVNALYSSKLKLFLIDYVPIKRILAPITDSRNTSYLIAAILLGVSIAAALLLYRYIQIPVRDLLLGAKRMRQGDYSVRLSSPSGNEFGYVLESFNLMAEEVQQLVEKVHTEQIYSREAKLKQLQSQINPHFLYNCLYYITNMASMGNNKAVTAMSLNLGDYYRYTTRNENQSVRLTDELKLVTNYLKIQQLRTERLIFSVEVPDVMQEQLIPRLLLQPVVENAVIHGIEPVPGEGTIQIRGYREGGSYFLTVMDDGAGLSEEEAALLNKQIRNTDISDAGCGLSNVHQRLVLKYGEEAGITVTSLTDGGCLFILQWPAVEL